MRSCCLSIAAVGWWLLLSLALATAQPTKNDFWKGTSMDAMVEQTKVECAQKNDETACMKYKVLNLLDQLYRKDNFKISETVEVTRNSYPGEDASSGRSSSSANEASFLDNLRGYLVSHDFTFLMPFDSSVSVSSRNLDQDELDFSVKFGSRSGAVAEGRKSKLKKVIIPIMVFILLKAMTLIPLAIGVLGLKAWNALQLSFFSFVVSVGLAIFQLCKKIAADNHHAGAVAHGPWEYQAGQFRSLQDNLPLAYSPYGRDA